MISLYAYLFRFLNVVFLLFEGVSCTGEGNCAASLLFSKRLGYWFFILIA